MEQYIEPVRIANAIMQDEDFTGFYLIVEGKKDYKLYSKFICDDNVRIRQAFGKEKVKEVLKILKERNFKKDFAILDSDFDRIFKIKESDKNIFKTDFHDSEVMILNTEALENVISVYCDKDKIYEFEHVKGENIRKILFNLGKEIGKLKLVNKKNNFGLKFKSKSQDGKSLKYHKFISHKDLSFLGLDLLIETVINYSRNVANNVSTKEQIIKEYLKIDKNMYNINDLVNGHDLTNILYILIKKVLKSSSRSINDFNCVEESLLLAYNKNHFINTQLYRDLKQWSIQNDIKVFNFEEYEIKNYDISDTKQISI